MRIILNTSCDALIKRAILTLRSAQVNVSTGTSIDNKNLRFFCISPYMRSHLSQLGLLIISFGLLSCEEAIDWELSPGDNGKLVVEAILTNEFITQEIHLSQSFDQLNVSPPPINDAMVRIEANGQVIQFFSDSSQTGVYKSEVPFAILDDLWYTLEIEWQEVLYQASSQLSTVFPIPSIQFQPIRNSDTLIIQPFAPIYNANQQAMYELNIDWSHIGGGGLTTARLLYFTFNSTDISGLFTPEANREQVSFPTGSIVIVKKFGLNEDFADYLRALAQETEWKGNTLDATPSSLSSNISNDALGFFSTCAVLSDTLIAQ